MYLVWVNRINAQCKRDWWGNSAKSLLLCFGPNQLSVGPKASRLWLQCCAWKESFDLGYVSRVYFVNLSTPLKHLEPPFCLSVARRGNAWAGLRIRGPRHLTPSEVTRTVISEIVCKCLHTCDLIYSPTVLKGEIGQINWPLLVVCLFVLILLDDL